VQVAYHPEAAREVIGESRYYEERVPGLGIAFVDAVDAAMKRIVGNPLRFSPGSQGTRYRKLGRFPQRLVYRVEGETIRVYAIAHPKREPGYWAKRL
jgi:plasmid stabilization system protein ParE